MKKPSSNRDPAPEVGTQFNNLTFVRPLNEKDKWTNFLGEWKCSCGQVVKLAICLVKRGFTQSCGCIKPIRPPTEIGKKIHKLTLLEVQKERRGKAYLSFGIWECECGNTKRIRIDQVKRGNTTSCGCAMRHAAPRIRKREYYIYHNILKRCYDPNCKNYKNYGGRGIAMCHRWFIDFENFLADMGPRPSPAHSVERKNNDGNYEPDNCIWATKAVQNRNRRDTIRLVLDGVQMCQKDVAQIIGCNETSIIKYRRKGFTPEQIRDHFAQRKAA